MSRMASFSELELDLQKLVSLVQNLKSKKQKKDAKIVLLKSEVTKLRGLVENQHAEFEEMDRSMTAFAKEFASWPLKEQNESADARAKLWMSQEQAQAIGVGRIETNQDYLMAHLKEMPDCERIFKPPQGAMDGVKKSV